MQSQISRIQGFIDKLEDRPSKAENKSRRDSQIGEISSQIKQQLLDAGFNSTDAATNAALYAERYFARAERRSLGENPVELFNQSLDEIARRELAPEAAYAQGEIYNQDRAFQTEFRMPETIANPNLSGSVPGISEAKKKVRCGY